MVSGIFNYTNFTVQIFEIFFMNLSDNTTNSFKKIGIAFYSIGIIAYGVQQIVIKDFRTVIVPEFPAWVHQYLALPYITGVVMIVAGIFISGVFKIKRVNPKTICLYLGLSFLLIILTCHIPYRLLISPYKAKHLGVWTDALKELALSGGAFVLAGSSLKESISEIENNWFKSIVEKLIPFGRIFFSITMISFGMAHLYYTESISGLVPKWIGMQTFWTYFAAAALISSGVAIILKIFIRPVTLLLAIMLFLWVFLVHIPGAIENPYEFNGNNIVSAFDALLFSGVALVIHYKSRNNF